MRAAAVYNQHTQRHLSAVFVPHRKKHIPLRFSEARCTGLLLEAGTVCWLQGLIHFRKASREEFGSAAP